MEEAVILNGRKLADSIENQLAKKVEELYNTTKIRPKLATILVGDFAPSITYVNMKKRACKRVGIDCDILNFNSSITTDELIEKINQLNNDNSVDGILIQHPLPMHINEQLCFDSVAVEKDVDGVSSYSFGMMCNKEKAFVSATPLGIMKLLEEYKIKLTGKHAVVVGRSAILGKPVAMQLLNANATVTICHSKTENLKDLLKQADIVVAALGKPKYLQADWFKKGVVLIDAGYNEGNVGDIDLENASLIASAYTPVPGGVGPMTIASLLTQTVEAYQNKIVKK